MIDMRRLLAQTFGFGNPRSLFMRITYISRLSAISLAGAFALFLPTVQAGDNRFDYDAFAMPDSSLPIWARPIQLVSRQRALPSFSKPSGDPAWNNNGTDWNTATNWTPNNVPSSGDTATFNVAEVNQPNLSSADSILNLVFTSTGTGYDLTSSSPGIALTLLATTGGANSAITSQITSGAEIIDAPIILGAAGGSTQTFNQSNGGTLTLNGVISSTNTITLNLAGGGTYNINGTNTYTGTTNQTAGNTVVIGNSSAFGASTIKLSSNGGGLKAGVDLTGANEINNPIIWAASATLKNSGSFGIEFGGNVDLNGTAETITSALSAGATFDGVISDDGGGGLSIVTSSTSAVTLNGINTYAGNTTISGNGKVVVTTIGDSGVNGNLGAGPIVELGSTSSSGTLAYNGPGEANNRTYNMNGTTGGATIDASGATGTLVLNGNITETGGGTKTLTLKGSITQNGVISSVDPITLTLSGTGTFTLNGTNTHSGTTNQTAGSTIVIGNSAAFGSSTLTLSSNAGSLTAGIDLTGANEIPNPIVWGANATLNNSGTFGIEFGGNVDLNGAGRTINSSVNSAIFDGVISDDAGGGVTISTANTSTVTLNGLNTYTGNTTISGNGKVVVSTINNSGVSGNLGAGSVIGLGSGNKGGILAYTGAGETTNRTIDLSGTTGGATIDVSGATGPLVLTSDFTASGSGAKTLTLKSSSAGTNSTIGGAIPDSGGGATSLLKTGNGSWNISGANTYSGGTTIGNGSLVLSGSSATLGSGDVTLNSGATKLEISTGVLNGIGDSATLSIAGGGPVVQLDTGVDEVVGGLVLAGVTEAPGVYNSSNESGFITGSGMITVVPEPSTWNMAMAGTGLLLALQWLRRKRS